MSEPQIRALFTEIADGEPARSQVDIQLARRRGRARLRRRRASMAGTSVLAAAAVVVLAMGVGPVRLGSGPPASRPAAPRQFNPLVPYLSFGWLPPGNRLTGRRCAPRGGGPYRGAQPKRPEPLEPHRLRGRPVPPDPPGRGAEMLHRGLGGPQLTDQRPRAGRARPPRILGRARTDPRPPGGPAAPPRTRIPGESRLVSRLAIRPRRLGRAGPPHGECHEAERGPARGVPTGRGQDSQPRPLRRGHATAGVPGPADRPAQPVAGG